MPEMLTVHKYDPDNGVIVVFDRESRKMQVFTVVAITEIDCDVLPRRPRTQAEPPPTPEMDIPAQIPLPGVEMPAEQEEPQEWDESAFAPPSRSSDLL